MCKARICVQDSDTLAGMVSDTAMAGRLALFRGAHGAAYIRGSAFQAAKVCDWGDELGVTAALAHMGGHVRDRYLLPSIAICGSAWHDQCAPVSFVASCGLHKAQLDTQQQIYLMLV